MCASSETGVSVIIPVFNEGEELVHTIESVEKELRSLVKDYEIIVVDDGSYDDGCAELPLKLKGSGLKVLRYQEHRGKGHAFRYGYKWATGRLIVLLDANGFDPSYLSSFLKKAQEADIVIGSKYHPDSKVIGYPSSRRFLSLSFNRLLRILFGIGLSDTQCGFKLFRRAVLDELLSRCRIDGYALDAELLILASKKRFRIAEHPIRVEYGWRMELKAILSMLVDTMKLFLRLHLAKRTDSIRTLRKS